MVTNQTATREQMKTSKNLYKRKSTYYLRYNVNGKDIRQSLKVSTLREAEKKANQILGSIIDLKSETDVIQKVARAKNIYSPKSFPINKLLPLYEKFLLRKGATLDVIKSYRRRVNQFTTWLKNNYSDLINLSEISYNVTQEFSDWLSDTGISAKTYNESLNALYAVIEKVKNDSGLKDNPFNKENLPRKEKQPVSRKEFSENETIMILSSFKSLQHIKDIQELEVLFHLGTWGGLRLKDACLLKWEDVDLNRHIIYVIPGKTKKYGTKVQIPLHPLLKENLLNAKNWRANEYVLPGLTERYKKRRDNISKAVRLIIKYNGFETMQDKGQGAQRMLSACLYGFHSLRYTFVSACAKAGIPLTLVQEIVGHKNPAMTKHYTKFDNQYRQQAINKLTFGYNKNNFSQDKKQQIISLLETAPDQVMDEVIKLLKNNINI